MSDESALLAAIIAHPDEDTPRLMYADWLEEHDQPERAEFIRIQCAPDADETTGERAAELEERNRGRWFPRLPTFAGAAWEFRRGFPEILTIAGQLFMERYEAFARVPWVKTLCVCEVQHWVTMGLADGRPWNPNWVELELQEPEDGRFLLVPTIEALARCSQARQLRLLRLTHFDLLPGAVQALVDSPHLQQLRQLVVDRSNGPGRLGPLRNRFGDRLATE
jgi:uncharacterized protein (TIGR02996 family)